MLRKTWVNRFTRQLKPDPWQVRQEAQDRSQKMVLEHGTVFKMYNLPREQQHLVCSLH